MYRLIDLSKKYFQYGDGYDFGYYGTGNGGSGFSTTSNLRSGDGFGEGLRFGDGSGDGYGYGNTFLIKNFKIS